jgi:hypothetical protein
MKKISENDKGISTMILIVVVIAIVAVAAIGAFFILDSEDKETYKITYRIGANIGEGETVFVYLDNVQIDENSDLGNQIIQATHEYSFKGDSDETRTLSAELKDSNGNVLLKAEYPIIIKKDTKEYFPEFTLSWGA